MPFVLLLQTSLPHTTRMAITGPGFIAVLAILGLLLDNTWASAHEHPPSDTGAHAAFHGETPARHELVVESPGLKHHHVGANRIAGHPHEHGNTAARRAEIGDDLGDLKVVRPVELAFVGASLAPIPPNRGPTFLARQLRAFLQVFLI